MCSGFSEAGIMNIHDHVYIQRRSHLHIMINYCHLCLVKSHNKSINESSIFLCRCRCPNYVKTWCPSCKRIPAVKSPPNWWSVENAKWRRTSGTGKCRTSSVASMRSAGKWCHWRVGEQGRGHQTNVLRILVLLVSPSFSSNKTLVSYCVSMA